jgi:hypothetical protein
MIMMIRARLVVCFFLSVAVMAVSGCGGGGDSGGAGSSPSPTGSTAAFNQARGFDDAVTGIVPVNDGSGDVFVAGYFTTYTDVPSHRLIRLADAASPKDQGGDPCFAPYAMIRVDQRGRNNASISSNDQSRSGDRFLAERPKDNDACHR